MIRTVSTLGCSTLGTLTKRKLENENQNFKGIATQCLFYRHEYYLNLFYKYCFNMLNYKKIGKINSIMPTKENEKISYIIKA